MTLTHSEHKGCLIHTAKQKKCYLKAYETLIQRKLTISSEDIPHKERHPVCFKAHKSFPSLFYLTDINVEKYARGARACI